MIALGPEQTQSRSAEVALGASLVGGVSLSIIVPVYNEGKGVYAAHRAITQRMSIDLPELEYEIIFVDDGSIDDSFLHLTELHAQNLHVRVIRLAGNCGSHMAIRAGLEHARGTVACFLACDLQDPPEIIHKLLADLKPPVQIVWAVRGARHDSLSSKLFATMYYQLARLIVSRSFPPSGASMFLLGPSALRAVRLYPERNLTLEGMFATMGFRQAYVRYERQSRQSGRSRWTLNKRLKLFADFFVGYSYAPIRFISYAGIFVAIVGFLYALFVVFNRMFLSAPIEGWSSLMVVVLLVGGIQMLMLGVVGEYIWRTLDETRSRPRYLVDTILDNKAEPE